jgi:surface antigen
VSVTSIGGNAGHRLGWRRAMLALCLGMLALRSGYAQLSGFYPINSDGVSLDNADFTALVDAANNLLNKPRLVKGDNTSWRNEQSGSHGTISVADSFHHGSMMCHTLNYLTNPMASPSGNTITLKWCKTGDGSWKILS